MLFNQQTTIIRTKIIRMKTQIATLIPTQEYDRPTIQTWIRWLEVAARQSSSWKTKTYKLYKKPCLSENNNSLCNSMNNREEDRQQTEIRQIWSLKTTILQLRIQEGYLAVRDRECKVISNITSRYSKRLTWLMRSHQKQFSVYVSAVYSNVTWRYIW